jgi:hypothetical protein
MFQRSARLDRGDQVGGADRDDLLQRAGTDHQIGGSIGREPSAATLDPDLPALLVRQPAHQ